MAPHCSENKTQTPYSRPRRYSGASLTLDHSIPHSPIFEETLLTLSSKHMQNWTILTTSSAITLFWATITSCLEISKQISLLLSLLARVNFYIAAWVNVSKGVRSHYSSAQNSPVEKFKQNKIQSPHQWSTRPPTQSGPLLPLLFSFSFIFICSVHTGLLVVS